MNAKIISFAIEAHANTNHLYDGKPYSVHLSMVAINAMKFIDIIPENKRETVLSACWLHDTIEDCRLTYNDIVKVAGIEVADIVYAVTNEKGKNREERASEAYYNGIIKTPWARFVKLCDRLSNIQYSKETDSRMLDVYRKEQNAFISHLFEIDIDIYAYAELIDEINNTLKP